MARVEDVPEKTFSLNKVEGTMKVAKMVEISPFCTIQVHGNMKVKDHDKRVNITVEQRTMDIALQQLLYPVVLI